VCTAFVSSFVSAITIFAKTPSAMIATIGEKSIGPIVNGSIRRHRRRYGSHTSYRKRCTEFSEYGMRIQDVMM
jgi:hypothetical protein